MGQNYFPELTRKWYGKTTLQTLLIQDNTVGHTFSTEYGLACVVLSLYNFSLAERIRSLLVREFGNRLLDR